MTELASGALRKMKTELLKPVQYALPLGDEAIPLNQFLGKSISLEFLGAIECVSCKRKIKKSFAQGHCYPCFTSLASCDRCIMSPERCHFAEGTCRDPAWGEANCNIDHFVYLANSSGIKVGITRHSQIPTRWMDQGAVEAMPLFRVSTRYQSGLVEVAFKEHVADKTHWQRMLKGEPEARDLKQARTDLLPEVQARLQELREQFGIEAIEALPDAEPVQIEYPVLRYPTKVVSKNFDKQPIVEGTLEGIKGQYLLFDTGVINIRKFGGYHVTLSD